MAAYRRVYDSRHLQAETAKNRDQLGNPTLCNRVRARPIFTKFFVLVIYGRGSVLLWRRSDTLCTSGFMDVVIFALPFFIMAYRWRLRATHAGFTRDCWRCTIECVLLITSCGDRWRALITDARHVTFTAVGRM